MKGSKCTQERSDHERSGEEGQGQQMQPQREPALTAITDPTAPGRIKLHMVGYQPVAHAYLHKRPAIVLPMRFGN